MNRVKSLTECTEYKKLIKSKKKYRHEIKSVKITAK